MVYPPDHSRLSYFRVIHVIWLGVAARTNSSFVQDRANRCKRQG